MAKDPKFKKIQALNDCCGIGVKNKSSHKFIIIGALIVIISSAVGWVIVDRNKDLFEKTFKQLMTSNQSNYKRIKDWRTIVDSFNSFQYPVTYSIHPAETFELSIKTDPVLLNKLQKKMARKFDTDFLQGLIITDDIGFLWHLIEVIVLGYLLKTAKDRKTKGVSLVVWIQLLFTLCCAILALGQLMTEVQLLGDMCRTLIPGLMYAPKVESAFDVQYPEEPVKKDTVGSHNTRVRWSKRFEHRMMTDSWSGYVNCYDKEFQRTVNIDLYNHMSVEQALQKNSRLELRTFLMKDVKTEEGKRQVEEGQPNTAHDLIEMLPTITDKDGLETVASQTRALQQLSALRAIVQDVSNCTVSHSDWVQVSREKMCHGGLQGSLLVVLVQCCVVVGLAIMAYGAIKMEMEVTNYGSWKSQWGAFELSYTGSGYQGRKIGHSNYV